jgi:hypothetical protein
VTLPVRHYYHLYAAGAWIIPVREHVTALALSGLRAPMVIGLTGAPGGRQQAREMLTAMLSEAGLPAPERWAKASYLRRLPPPPRESRWQAETWVSSESGPKAADLLPGWPRYAP